jgi:hypothetical protein
MAGLYGNARPWPQPQRNKVVSNIPQLPGKGKFLSAVLNRGMNSSFDPADLDPAMVQMAQNVRVRFDKTIRRLGTTLMTPTKPNSLPVIGLFFFKKNNGDSYYFRFTASTMHYHGGIWTAVTPGTAVKATGVLEASGTFSNGETVTIGSKTYTFQTVLTNVDGNVLIGANAAASLTNLKAAITLGAGSGTLYAALTTAHPSVTATTLTPTTLTIEALTAGLAGNAIELEETCTNAEFDGETLSGGLEVGALAGSATDYFQGAVVLDTFVFANNGVNVLQQFDEVAGTYKPLGNAPEYRYVTGFFNRVVGANLVGSDPNAAQIGWSGENNLEEWDPLVDETAGNTPLVESPNDLGDNISGIFGFTNVLAILREQSIWLASKQPIPTFPFNPYCAFPGVGCNAPYSAEITSNGLTWADRRTATVWHYTPGSAPVPIGRPVERTLMDSADDENLMFASYDPIQNEYTLFIPQAAGGDRIIAWTYNFRSQSWSQDVYWGVSHVSDADFAGAVLTIDQLQGRIDDLAGTINELGAVQDVVPQRAFGRKDGEILLEEDDETTDPAYLAANENFETLLLSKSYTFPTDDMYVAELRIEIIPIKASDTTGLCSVTLSYSKDGGATIATPTKTKAFVAPFADKPKIFTWTKQIKCRRFAWQLTADDGQFAIIGYEVHVYKSGESSQ